MTSRAAGADEGADQAVKCDVAAGCQAGLLGCRGARLAGGVAGREHDEVGVEPEVENLAESQQSVRPVAAEAGQQAPAAAAHLGAREVTTPWVAKWMIRYWLRSLRASIPVSVKASPVTICASLGSNGRRMLARDLQLLRRNRLRPGRQRQHAIAVGGRRDHRRAACGRRRVLAEAEIFLRRRPTAARCAIARTTRGDTDVEMSRSRPNQLMPRKSNSASPPAAARSCRHRPRPGP